MSAYQQFQRDYINSLSAYERYPFGDKYSVLSKDSFKCTHIFSDLAWD